MARVAVALTHSVFWSIMTPLAARMAPEGRYGLGLAVVMCGTVVATVMGLPIGTKLGHLFGWQEAFAVIGLAAVLLMGFIALFLPPCPATSAGSVKSLPVILKRPTLLQLYGLTAVAVLGNYTVYSFIAPILQTVGSFTASDTVVFLFVFGASGIIGTTIATKYAGRHVSSSLVVPLGVLAACLVLIVPACGSYASVMFLFVVWGAAITALMIGFQTVLLSVASDAADVATSLYSGIFNVGIGGGAFLGSLISEHAGFVPLSFAGASLVGVATLFCIAVWIKTGCAVLAGAKGASRSSV